MNRFAALLKTTLTRLFAAISRFSLTVICLIGATILLCYMVSLHRQPELIVHKLSYTFLVGSFLGVAAQFACERFSRLNQRRLTVYAISTLLIIGYYLILMPAPALSQEVTVRTFVAVAAMFCAFVWVPSYREAADFNQVSLVHFKSALISVLYSAVLAAGCASIIAAVDTLLFNVNEDAYAYTMIIIWVMFATLYYLSLLPRFNSQEPIDQEFARYSAQYPRFLEILVSYIAIPLVTVFTLVLTAYFIKILFTLKWPSGQLGSMVLAYSAAGLIIYILASLPDNRFTRWYIKLFPKVLVPVVIMQLISVGIRLDAYGITESRYYIALFGLFALLCAVLLSFLPVSKNGLIAVLAACFAILSVVPPIDAFTVSRHSQINRLERMLEAEGLLHDGQITPKSEVSMNLRLETSSILNYLQAREYTRYVAWLPTDFNPYNSNNIKNVLGFEPAYPGMNQENNYFFATLEPQHAVDISGYSIMVHANSHRGAVSVNETPLDFEVGGVKYQMLLERLSEQEVKVVVRTATGQEVIATGLYDFARTISGTGNAPKEALPAEQMSFEVLNQGYKMRIMFQNLNITTGDATDAGVDYGLIILFGAPSR